jgi:hypothetical protein
MAILYNGDNEYSYHGKGDEFMAQSGGGYHIWHPTWKERGYDSYWDYVNAHRRKKKKKKQGSGKKGFVKKGGRILKKIKKQEKKRQSFRPKGNLSSQAPLRKVLDNETLVQLRMREQRALALIDGQWIQHQRLGRAYVTSVDYETGNFTARFSAGEMTLNISGAFKYLSFPNKKLV